MRLGRSLFSIRRSNRVHAKLYLREERIIGKVITRIVSVIYIGFSFVDWASAGQKASVFLSSFFLRLAIVILAISVYKFLRGRVRYGLRFFIIYFLFLSGTQLMMIVNQLSYTPYFVGINLVMFSVVALFPMRWRIASIIHALAVSPTLIYFTVRIPTDGQMALIGLSNTLGMTVLCVAVTSYIRKEIESRISSDERLSKFLRNSEADVREKTSELVKRKRFESQFSPQVVESMLENIHAFDTMQSGIISTIVVDIKDSTQKANTLNSKAYTHVLEEVFDIIADCFLKHNITIDKFIGDGVQAFAGSPTRYANDLERAVTACLEVQRILDKRSADLQRHWNGPLELRFGISEGEALVGFLGKGALRSFTAIGRNISFAHRLCAKGDPGSVVVYSHIQKSIDLIFSDEIFDKYWKEFDSLKGFGDMTFKVLEIRLRADRQDRKLLL